MIDTQHVNRKMSSKCGSLKPLPYLWRILNSKQQDFYISWGFFAFIKWIINKQEKLRFVVRKYLRSKGSIWVWVIIKHT